MRATRKLRTASFRRRFHVPRDLYLQAVRRHDARVVALHTEYWTIRLSPDLRESLFTRFGREWHEPPVPPELFHSPEDIARDDAIIGFYLEDNPGQRPVPSARGRDISELWENYTKTREFAAWQEFRRREVRKTAKQLAARFTAEEKKIPRDDPSAE